MTIHVKLRTAFWLPYLALAPLAATAMSPTHDRDVRAYNLAHGRVVFTEQCMRCHENGKRGAPMLGNAEDWAARLQKPLSALIKNAQDGHGDMPPKGELELTDQDVAAAVAYVTYYGRQILAVDLNNLPATAAGPTGATLAQATSSNPCIGYDLHGTCNTEAPAHHVVFNMFLMLIGQERWK